MKIHGLVLALLALSATPAWAIGADEINNAKFDGAVPEGRSAIVAKLQVLLDRAHFSPGVIDGYWGDNVRTAVRAFEQASNLPADGEVDADLWAVLSTADRGEVIDTYVITEEDVSRLTGAPLPEDYAKLAEMDWLGYESAAEAIAEKFHMDVDFLKSLNPSARFTVGEQLFVARPADDADTPAARLRAVKSESRLYAYDENGDRIASYPVTIGSSQTPSPSGMLEITGVAIDPTYQYRPDVNFKQGDNDTELTLPPGPNGPVGNVWIDLSEPTFGLHGTADPASIAKTASHGCVRLTNWDARELANLVTTGVPVEFVD